MKRLFVFFALMSAVYTAAQSQVVWYSNYQVAQAMAIEKDQLIVMDFWATWCGPCKNMDAQMWSRPEFKKLSEKFVPLKIDVDRNNELPGKYSASSIPKVVIITVTGEVVWEQVGFSSAQPFEEIFSMIPENLNGKSKEIFELTKEEKNFELGQIYQNIGQGLQNKIGEGLLDLSDKYFKRASKESEDKEMVLMAEMNQILNDAYRGKTKKALKKVGKLEDAESNELKDLKNYIAAFCYKCEGDDKNYMQAKNLINDPAYKEELEKNQ